MRFIWPYPPGLAVVWALPILAVTALMYVAATEYLTLGLPLLYAGYTLAALLAADASVWLRSPVGHTLARWAFFVSEIALLYFGAWALGWTSIDRPDRIFVFEYPSVAAGINEMVALGFAAVAVVHLIVLWRLARR